MVQFLFDFKDKDFKDKRPKKKLREDFFKYFKEAKEDRFTSFLAVPLQRGVKSIGVITLQHERKNYFSERIDAFSG